MGHVRWRLGLAAILVVAACSDDGGEPSASSSSTTSSTAPASATWEPLAEAPIEGRVAQGVVWTGREMVVWGGVTRGATPEPASDGAAYDPVTDTWRTIAPPPAGVLGDVGTAAVWTGDEAIFWAGNSPDGPAAGAIYDPEADTWRPVADGPLGPREGYSSVWTGTELLIIDGTSGDQGARPVAAAFDPIDGSWRLPSALNDLPGLAPSGAVWTGDEVLIGGALYLCPELGSVCTDTRPILLAYDPATDTSREIDRAPDVGADPLVPIGWTGTAVVFRVAANPSAGLVRYTPGDGTWSIGRTPPCTAELADEPQTAWLDSRYVVPCGPDDLQIYDLEADTWETIHAGPSPLPSRAGSAIVWTGRDLLAWGGVERSTGNPTPNSGARLRLG